MKKLAATLLTLVLGCGHPGDTQLTSDGASLWLKTIEHDGHKFVCMDWKNGGGLLHHPDCPCLKPKQAEKHFPKSPDDQRAP